MKLALFINQPIIFYLTCYFFQNHNDYINIMTSHSKMLKDKEHSRLMEMVEEEHAIKMAMHQEKRMSATIERQILELKKVYEENMNNNNINN